MISTLANKLLDKLGFQTCVEEATDCDHSFFVDIFEQALDENLPGLINNPKEKEGKIHNIQVVIDQLAAQVLGVDLSHIEAQCIVEGSEVHIHNLLEIFDGLLDLVMEDLDGDDEENQDCEYDEKQQEDGTMEDSNMISEDHEVLSDVFQQEDISHHSITHGSAIAEKPFSPSKQQSSAFVRETIQTQAINSTAINSTNGTNSTNELIREAETLEKREHNTRRSRPTKKMNKTSPPSQQRDEVECSFVNEWSNILTQTNSAVESFTDGKEIGVRPRRQLGAEKRQQQQEMGEGVDSSKKKGVVLHSHTHHHYHHKLDNSSNNNSFSSSSSSSSSKKSSADPNRDPKTINSNSNDGSSSNSTSSSSSSSSSSVNPVTTIGDNRPPKKDSSKIKADGNDSSSSAASSFLFNYDKPTTTTNKSRRRNDNVKPSIPTTNDDMVDVKTTLPSHKEFLKSLHESSIAETATNTTRSRQLSELSSRLQNLRDELRGPEKSESVPKTRQQQQYDNKENNLPTGDTKRKLGRKGDKSKVSFASEVMMSRRDDVIYSCSSDTEIDYSSPISVKVTTKRKVVQPSVHKKKKDLFAVLARNRFSKKEDEEETNRRRNRKGIPWREQQQHEHLYSKRRPQLDRDDRLKEIQNDYKSDNLHKKRQLKQIRHDYSQQRQALVGVENRALKQQTNLEKPKSFVNRETTTKKVSKKAPSTYPPEADYAARLANIYKKSNKPEERRGREPLSQNKCRKRSASSSPVGRRNYKSRLVLYEDEILPVMQEEFPFLQLSPHTAKMMWQKQMRQVHTLCKAAQLNRPSKAQKQIEDAQRKQELLSRIIQKELDHNNRLKEYKDHKFEEGLVKKKLAERRQRSARARKYYDEYAVRNKSRMLNKRSKEEKIFKKLFEDGLEIQKERLRELKSYAREQREKNEKRQQNEIESMENYYRGQFSMLAETISKEKHDVQVRQKAQNQLLLKMRREMRNKMEHDIQTIQDQLINEQDSASFRQIDADNMRKEFQLATFKSTKF